MVIEQLFRPCKRKGNTVGMSFGEERIALAITQFLFDTPQEPLIPSALAGIFQYSTVKLQAIIARIGELVGIEKAQEVCKLAGVATMRCSREQQDTLGAGRKPLSKLIAPRLGDPLTLSACRTFVSLVDNHEVPGNLL